MLNVEKARADKIYNNDKLQPVILAVGAGIGADFDITKIRYGKIIIMADADVDGAWGKMLNVEKARADKIYNNDKLQPVILAVGAGIGADFDITKIRYGKIIIMADADVDGAHIRTLLLTFFFRYMRPLIENGNVYLAQPPLYKLSKRGFQDVYCYTDEEMAQHLEEMGRENVNIQRYKGLGEMNPEQLWETTMNPESRTLVKVEMEDAIKADEIFTILMGDEIAPRREFIEQNAKYVKNLDI